jgi:NAD(P)-dependent dehydrogenase (short-subunit alcohol dehydrogenase family)
MDSRKTVLITGANSGIGLAASVLFAHEGWTVIMACRNELKGMEARRAVVRASQNERITMLQVDLSSFQSIRHFARQVKSRFMKLDALINNAAYFAHGSPHRLSEDGIELTFAVNTVGPYLLTEELKELLLKAEDPRVLHASSNIIKHFFDPKKELRLNRVTGTWPAQDKFTVYDQYRDSKMALVMLMFKQASVYRETPISFHALQINGAKMSKSTLEGIAYPWKAAARIQNLFFPPPDKMAEKYVQICSYSRFGEISGKLINHRLQVMEPAPKNPSISMQTKQLLHADYYPFYADNKKVQNELWEVCIELTGKQLL